MPSPEGGPARGSCGSPGAEIGRESRQGSPPLDVATGEALEERAVAPVDLTGWLGMALGHLYVLHGLPEAR
jgi:hypothetical protein